MEVEISLNPLGLGLEKKNLGKIRIINDGTGDRNLGNYRVEFLDRKGRVFRKRAIHGYKRKTEPMWKLMAMAMESYYKEQEDEQNN